MKTKTFHFHVGREQIRRLVDPYGTRRDRYIALVQVRNLPADLPLDVNPRNQNTSSRVSRQIEQSLLNEPKTFHLKNRGLTVIAKNIEYDTRSQTLVLTVPENSNDYGVLDGGHTYQVIRKNAMAPIDEETTKTEPAFLDAHVGMEIMEGLPDELIVDIARARNTSAQVKGFSLANLENTFDWIKDALKGEPYANKIAYRENEDDNEFPIDIMEIVGFSTMFHPDFSDADNPPILTYSGKGRCLDHFSTEANQSGYISMAPILKDVLKLYDFIHINFASMYEEIGGFSGLNDPTAKHKGVKLGRVSEVKQYPDGFQLYYLGKVGEYRFPDGWLYPVVGAMRSLVEYKPQRTTWKVDPFDFFKRHGKKFVTMTLEAGKTLGRTPAAIGKNKPHWVQLHDRVSLILARSGNQ